MNFNLTLIAQAITFAILILVIVKFVWPPLLNAIETRQKEIADGLAAAQEGKQALQEADQNSKIALNKAKQEANAIIGQAEKRANEIVDEAKGTAKTEGDRIIESAKSEIEQEVNRAKEGLRAQVSTLAMAGAEKILRKEIDAKTHTAMLSKLAAEL